MKLARSAKNPILTPTDKYWENKAVYNCGAFEYKGKIHLLYRAQGDDMVSRLGLARLSKPDEVEERSETPLIKPDPHSTYESHGLEDPRVIKMKDAYYIVYVAASKVTPITDHPDMYKRGGWRIRVSLMTTTNFHKFNRYGVILRELNSKDGVIFPEKVDGKYILLHKIDPEVRLAVSQDLYNFEDKGMVLVPREGTWDGLRVGAGAPPIKSPFGWILFYHGVDLANIYRLGITVLDLKNPLKIIARTDDPILEPEEKYEKEGMVNNVVFTCGAIETDKEFLIYYGGGDDVICLSRIQKEEVYNWIKNSK